MVKKARWEAPVLRRISAADAKSGVNGTKFDANFSKGASIPFSGADPLIFS
jgi:hypothetical protein